MCSSDLEEIYEEYHHCGYAQKDPTLFGSHKHRHIWFCLVSGKIRSLGFRILFFETKQLHIWVSEIRTKLHPLVHIRDGAILHKSRPGFRGWVNQLCFWILYLCRRKSSQTMEKYATRYFSISTMFFFCIGRGFRITTDSLNSGTLEEIYEECPHCGYERKVPTLFRSHKHRNIWFCLVSPKLIRNPANCLGIENMLVRMDDENC